MKLTKELKESKTYFMIQAKLQKEILMEIKQLRRDYDDFRRNGSGENPDRKSD